MSILSCARAALIEEQNAFRLKRGRLSEQIREELPNAAQMAEEIRGILLESLSRSLGGEDVKDAKSKSLKLQSELGDLLEERGYERSALFEAHMCEACGDTGYVKNRPCVCLCRHIAEQERAAYPSLVGSFDSFDASLFSDAAIPGWRNTQRGNMEINRLYCQHWSDTFPDVPDLFLNGGTGQGKTFLCACIAERVSRRGLAARYSSAIELFGDMNSYRAAREELMGAELLIIDDLGTEMATAFVQSALYDVLNTRQVCGRRTIVNSNLLADELKERYIPQIHSRLLGGYHCLYFYGGDVRRKVRHFSL
ncbi:DNA replication protein DnaC [Clostridia bacterium]|nr:DNA replication protein DnaC [Clostridia bacterium]